MQMLFYLLNFVCDLGDKRDEFWWIVVLTLSSVSSVHITSKPVQLIDPHAL